MLFGRSIFDSVVERLATEAKDAPQNAERPLSARIAGLNASFAAATAETDQTRFFRSESAYRDALADGAWPRPAEDSPPAEVPASEQLPPHLARLHPDEIAEDLAITPQMGIATLQDLRRAFARRNHPDCVSLLWKAQATTRMTIANQMIDAALRARRR